MASPFNIFTGRNEVVAKVIFLQVSVCPQGGRVSASVHAGMPYPPPDGEPPRMENPPGWRTPPGGEPPPPEADSSIRSTSGRYASYWNAYLFLKSYCEKSQFWPIGGAAHVTNNSNGPFILASTVDVCVYVKL